MGHKAKFVLSDLYIGAGYANEGGNNLEEFVVDAEFVHFLSDIKAESQRTRTEVELIINGNLFEFLGVPAVDHYIPTEIYPKEMYLDSSEAASVKRLRIIQQGHPQVFEALSKFMQAEAPQRRITIVKGNHDVNLFWPTVKHYLRKALGASGPQASLLLFAEDFISREKIYVEHGHQRTETMNRYVDFLDPRHPQDPTQLYYPPGSRFFIDFCNEVERNYGFANNIRPTTTLLWYALRWDLCFAAKLMVSLIHYAPTAMVINGVAPSNSHAIYTKNLLQDLHTEAACYDLLQHCAQDPALQQQLYHQLHQYLNLDSPEYNLIQAGVKINYDPLIVGRTIQEQYRSTLRQAAETLAERDEAKVVIFGQTHYPIQEQLDADGVYINTGCWLKDYSDASPETWQALFDKSKKCDQTPTQLTYARIDYDDNDNPTAQLLDFANVSRRDKLKYLPKKFFGWMNRFLSEPIGH